MREAARAKALEADRERWTTDLEAVLSRFLAILKRDFAAEIEKDPKRFKARVIQLIRQELPTRRGRPADPLLDAAYEMVQQGKTVLEVLKAQIRDFERLDPYTQHLAIKGLHQAIARRRRTGFHEKKAKLE